MDTENFDEFDATRQHKIQKVISKEEANNEG